MALAKARRRAMEYAELSQMYYNQGDPGATSAAVAMAGMWANVANAMKVGQALEADGVIPDPGDLMKPYGSVDGGVTTR